MIEELEVLDNELLFEGVPIAVFNNKFNATVKDRFMNCINQDRTQLSEEAKERIAEKFVAMLEDWSKPECK